MKPTFVAPETGGLLASPPLTQWDDLVVANADALGALTLTVGGADFQTLRRQARVEAADAALRHGDRLGFAAPPWDGHAPVVACGHQPVAYHPGVWVKNAAVARLAARVGGYAIEVVVDTDVHEPFTFSAPVHADDGRIHRVDTRLHIHEERVGAPFAVTSAPTSAERSAFSRAVRASIPALALPGADACVEAALAAVDDVGECAGSLAEFATAARRGYEADAFGAYASVPVTALVEGHAFRCLMAEVAMRAEEFLGMHNIALHSYRAKHRVRTGAQPFPDLKSGDGSFEMPFWCIADGVRQPLFARPRGRDTMLEASGARVGTVDSAARVTLEPDVVVAPRALALTLFARMFLSDLFVHGFGGGRYDEVTDDVVRAFLGVEPPRLAVASLTMAVPGSDPEGVAERLHAAQDAVERFKHNPDTFALDSCALDAVVCDEAVALVEEKRSLIAAIAAPDADRKTLGLRIRAVNERLSVILAPVGLVLDAELASAMAADHDVRVLTDRTYPYMLWSPQAILDEVERVRVSLE